MNCFVIKGYFINRGKFFLVGVFLFFIYYIFNVRLKMSLFFLLGNEWCELFFLLYENGKIK